MSRGRPASILLVGLLLTSVAPSDHAGATVITVVTDRADYVVGMPVTANGTIQFMSSFVQLNEPARVDWFDAAWVVLHVEYVVKVRVQAQPIAHAVATWIPSFPGMYHVNVSSNTTNGTPPTVNGWADFRVWAESDYVIALGVEVSTTQGAYERGELATAVASFTAKPSWVIGNVSRLERVQFTWFYPGGPAAHQASANVTNGAATDSWAPDTVGANYMITATYLGNDTVSNWTNFPVFAPTTPATDVSAGTNAVWTAAQSPWRVCGDLTVAATATLTIEPGVVVRFCRGSRLEVAGSLTGDASLASPILLTSYEYPSAPGDWAGVRFLPGSAGRLSGAIVEDVVDGIVAADSSPTLIGIIARAGTGEGVNFTRSSGVLRNAAIISFAIGVRLWDASATIEKVSVAGASLEGISILQGSVVGQTLRVTGAGIAGVLIDGATSVVLSDVTVGGGNYGLYASNTESLRVLGGSFGGASVAAVDLSDSAALFANISFQSVGQDFFLVSSLATLLNCSFSDVSSERTIIAPSHLVVQNFLAVQVTSDGAAVSGARVEVSVNGASLSARMTDGAGLASWIVVEDRVYNAKGVTNDAVVVAVFHSDYAIAGSPRSVDMATSHVETFSATANGLGALIALVQAVMIGLLVAFLLLVWRRSRGTEPAVAPPASEPSPAPPALLPGSAYAILGENGDRAFDRFVAEVGAGKPGLCLSRTRPEDVRTKYGLEGVPLYWLSRSPRDDAVRPTNLGGIVDIVRTGTAGHKGSLVLFDGLEYLMTQTDFGKVAKFVHELVDIAAERRAVLLLPLNPKSLNADRLAILTRDLRPLP